MYAFLPSFSRRIGKALRDGQKRLLTGLLPSLAITLPENEEELLAVSSPLWMEIGFGSGEHLAAQALKHPEIAFIGCEPYLNGVAQLLKTIEQHTISNIRIWQDDARVLLARLPDHSLSRVFILFPDPWPKKRHQRRRIISDAMLDLLAAKMAPGAELRVATDHQDYAEWMLAHLSRHPQFATEHRYPEAWHIPPADWVKTRYQEKAEAEGIGGKFFCYRRI